MPRTLAPPSAWTLAELLHRLAALVGLLQVHMECHPDAYQNPSGQLLRETLDAETRRLLHRDESTE